MKYDKSSIMSWAFNRAVIFALKFSLQKLKLSDIYWTFSDAIQAIWQMCFVFLFNLFSNAMALSKQLKWIKNKKQTWHTIVLFLGNGHSILKGTVHPKMKILSSFTHPQVVPNLYEFLCSAEHKGRYFEERLFWGTIDFHCTKKNTMEVNGAPELLCFPHSSKYLPLCSAEQRNSYRFGTTWGWVNDDIIFIFGWTIPLIQNSAIFSMK